VIITEDFVYIHMPKTGGTFVAAVLEELYRALGEPLVNCDRHGTCSNIPARHRQKRIVATVRNPLDRYVSQYRFGWWRIHPERYCGEQEMRRMFPHYPELSFAEFVELADCKFMTWSNPHLLGEARLGWHTEQFVRFFFKNSECLFSRIDASYLEDASFRSDMYSVHFLHTENLNAELHQWLVDLGKDPAALAWVLQAPKVLPPEGGRSTDDAWHAYYSPQLRQQILRRERLIYQIFPEFAVE
jgi:Sulfotransferase family